MASAISVRNVSKAYLSDFQALDRVSFEIKDGEFFGLLGPNGAGKSTLINIISGPTKIDSGIIEIYGVDINKKPEEAKMMLGVVPQEISFDSFFTVNESLLLQSGYFGIRNNQKRIDMILEKLSLKDKKNARTGALSGGMKRRLLIAKALVHKPKVLILDEPTAGVDVELRHTLWKYVQELNKDGLTILLTTHYLEEAERLCKRLAIINNGKLIALDKTKSLINSLGDTKKLVVTSKEKLPTISDKLTRFEAKQINDYQLSFSVCDKSINQVITALHEDSLVIKDIDVSSEKLEDVFIKLIHNNEQQ